MGRVVCILGKSGSGKDTVYRELLRDEALGLKPLVLYTTRPPREGEADGESYHFVSAQRLGELEQRFGAVERRVYDTVHGPWIYCTLNDGQTRSGNLLCIATPAAMAGYFSAFGRENVLPVYLRVPDGLRLRRALDREDREPVPRYAELCRRYLADEEDFSEEKLAGCGLVGSYDNLDLAGCVAALRADLLRLLKE